VVFATGTVAAMVMVFAVTVLMDFAVFLPAVTNVFCELDQLVYLGLSQCSGNGDASVVCRRCEWVMQLFCSSLAHEFAREPGAPRRSGGDDCLRVAFASAAAAAVVKVSVAVVFIMATAVGGRGSVCSCSRGWRGSAELIDCNSASVRSRVHIHDWDRNFFAPATSRGRG
jgi:hypothetical protein